MQWLIDLILTLSLAQFQWNHRGDPATPDFSLGDLIADNAWHTLNISSIIPIGSTMVIIRLVVRSTQINDVFRMRRTGDPGNSNLSVARFQVASRFVTTDRVVSVDSSLDFDYRITGSNFTTINMTIAGWFGPVA